MEKQDLGKRKDEYACSCRIIHEDILRSVRKQMPEVVQLCNLADFFKLFGDSTRIGILWALCESEMCVCDISALLNMEQSAVSHQLKILKQSRIVKNRRDGKVIYYSLDDDHIRDVLNLGMQHLME